MWNLCQLVIIFMIVCNNTLVLPHSVAINTVAPMHLSSARKMTKFAIVFPYTKEETLPNSNGTASLCGTPYDGVHTKMSSST